jgi:hypothetical protein
MAATSAGNYALFGGGYAGGVLSNKVDIFNCITGQWSTATLSQQRKSLTATTVGNYAIFAGGLCSTGSSFSNTVDIFNGLTGQWSTATLSQARDSLAATTVGDYALIGGGLYGSQAYSNVVDVFTTPEPATLSLLALGGLAILGRRRAARR